MYYLKKIIAFISLIFLTGFNLAQNNSDFNTITTAVPFLLINPHGQSMGIADIGVVASSEYYESGFTQNPALLSRYKKVVGGKISYKPWLLNFVPDIRMMDADFYCSLTKKITIGYSYNRISFGLHTLTDEISGVVVGQIHPVEYYHNLRYAQSLDSNLSLGLGLKYIVSDLTNGMYYKGSPTYPGKAIAVDIGLDYRKVFAKTETSFWRSDLGVSIVNIGNKVRYSDIISADFLPMNLSLGALFTFNKNLGGGLKYNLDLAYQCEKLLVPTPPIYKRNIDSMGYDRGIVYDANGDPVILRGRDPNRSVANAMITSFYDAPDGAKEEFAEILHKVGVENWLLINDLSHVAWRIGYLYENRNKGDRSYLTVGLGAKCKFIYLDGGLILLYKDYDIVTGRKIYVSGKYSWNVTLGFKYDFK